MRGGGDGWGLGYQATRNPPFVDGNSLKGVRTNIQNVVARKVRIEYSAIVVNPNCRFVFPQCSKIERHVREKKHTQSVTKRGLLFYRSAS